LIKISNIRFIEGAADFRLIDRKVLHYLKQYRESRRFVRGIISDMGFRHDIIKYKEEARKAGLVKYNLLVMMKFALTGVVSFSSFPLRIATYFGMVISFFSILYAFLIVYEKAVHDVPSGMASILVGIFFIGGIQLISIGVLGEYVSSIFKEVKKRPLYCVSEVINQQEIKGENADGFDG
jgi:dolichol-phosphate mannosyltransferase